jgi:hypothetical protein
LVLVAAPLRLFTGRLTIVAPPDQRRTPNKI